MAITPGRNEGRRQVERLGSLIHEVERFPDPAARESMRAIVQALMDLHNVGLERILETIAEEGLTGLALIDSLAKDDLVGGLLLLYGLHPEDLETRVRHGLDKARPALRAHGGNVELLGVADGMVRVRMLGTCEGCPSTAETLKRAIEDAIYEKAPDVTAIEIEAVAAQPGSSRMALPVLSR